jgi:hypothetical protein
MPLPLGSNINWPDVIAGKIPENFSAADEAFMLLRDGSQINSMLIDPRIDGGIAFDSTVESQQRDKGCQQFATNLDS